MSPSSHPRRREKASAPPLRSAVSWTLLGLVIEHPGYGHELVQRFERAYGSTLPLGSSSQIYEALDALASRAFISELEGGGEQPWRRRQPKLRYGPTPAGIKAYQEWLVSQAREERKRSRLLTLQLAALAPEKALGIIERYELLALDCAHDAPLAPHEQVEDPRSEDEAAREGLISRLVNEEHRLSLDAKLNWIAYARAQLEAIAAEKR
jgi:DNA-binding PadR family transcriptional regulator